MERRRAGSAVPGPAAARALRAHRPVDRVRRRHLPPQGPQGRRLPARPHPRGGLHPARERPLLVVQGPAADDLPDPGQVPRRGASPRRAPARPRVHDEGRATRSTTPTPDSRRVPGAARRLRAIFARLGLEYVIVQADAGAMGGARSEEFLHPTPIGEDTFVRSAGGYAANVEAFTTVVPDAVADRGPAAPPRCFDSPGHAHDPTLVDLANAEHPRADGRAWTAADTLKNVVLALTHLDGTRELVVVGLPGDRDVDLKRVRGRVRARRGRGRPRRPTSRSNPGLVKGYIGPGRHRRRARRGVGHRPPLLRSTRGSCDGTAVGHRGERARATRLRPRRRPRLRSGRRHRDRDRARGRPRSRRVGPGRARPRHGDRPRVPARPQVRRGPRPQGARRERQARHRHDGLVRHRRHPHPRRHRRGETTTRRA